MVITLVKKTTKFIKWLSHKKTTNLENGSSGTQSAVQLDRHPAGGGVLDGGRFLLLGRLLGNLGVPRTLQDGNQGGHQPVAGGRVVANVPEHFVENLLGVYLI